MAARIFVLFCLSCFSVVLAARITLATYYDYPPFYDKDKPELGLNNYLATQLNRWAAGKYHFVAEYIPRRRVEQMLRRRDQNLVVAWVSPRFFEPALRDDYDWSPPMMWDQSLVISSRKRPVQFVDVQSLRGLRFSATFGHFYADLEPFIQDGVIKRQDAPNTYSAIRKLLADRNVDFGVIDQSTLRVFSKAYPSLADDIFVAPTPRMPNYSRHIMSPRHQSDVGLFIRDALSQLENEPEWQNIISFFK